MITALLLATSLTAGAKAQIDQLFAAYDKNTSPGCAVTIVRSGEVAYQRGYGMANLENHVPITPSTVFDIASTSKEFTGAVIMQLVAEGKLHLDDDIRKYVPEIPDYGQKITIANLLHHTSGLRDYTDLLGWYGYNSEDWTGTREALMLLSRQKNLNFAPGTEYSYSNTGYFLLSLIAGRVSGKPFREVVRERIVTPLSMTDTDVLDDHTLVLPGRATAYSLHGSRWGVEMSDWEQTGDGAVNTSVADMARWIINGKRFIDSLATFEKLASGETPQYGAGLAYGTRAGHRQMSHNGAWAGYRSSILMLPDDQFGTAVLCNAGNANPGSLTSQIADAMLGAAPKPGEPPKLDGVYLHRPSGTILTLGPSSRIIESTADAIDVSVADGPKRHYVRMPPPKPLTDQFNGRYQSAEISADWTAFTREKKLYLSGDRLGEVELSLLYENGFSMFGYIIEFTPDGFTLSNRGLWRFPFVRVK